MNDTRPREPNPFRSPFDDGTDQEIKDEWEDWSDEDAVTPIVNEVGESPLSPPASTSANPRQSMSKLKRLKSRQRQKAQNAKAGIKLDTDMSKFRTQKMPQHVAYQLRLSPRDRQSRTGKFVDAAALKALEGDPSSPSIGSFAWLKKKPKDASKTKKANKKAKAATGLSPQDLSPGERPIMIGFEMPADSDVVISPQTAVVATPYELFPTISNPLKGPPQPQPVSAWSPDSEDGRSLYRKSRAASSVYSTHPLASMPPMPALPSDLRAKRKDVRRTTIIITDDDDEDLATPVTLFEESPVEARKTPKAKGRERAPTDASSRSQGWWDQITTPFRPSPVERLPISSISPAADEPDAWWKTKNEKKIFSENEEARSPEISPGSTAGPSNEWWKDVDEKRAPASRDVSSNHALPKGNLQRKPSLQITVHAPSSPSLASSSRAGSVRVANHAQAHVEKARILVEESQTPPLTELPPPYERTPSKKQAVRYRAVFPPGHHLNSLYPPSPGPVSPGLAMTMTSQGAISMSDVPITPPPVATRGMLNVPLPPRTAGAFVSGDHFLAATGNGVRQKAERRRRRHEKEEALAMRVGGFWKGRGCIPASGCYGRAGREGRKRRRICLGLVGGAVALIILIIVLAVTLTHRGAGSVPYSPWLNLTDFPPMPTGVFTVVAPDNSNAISGCVSVTSLWSCSLPKEQAPGNSPYTATQPKFILQIQFDNNTRKSWDVTGQQPPQPTPNTIGEGTLQSANQTVSNTTAAGSLGQPSRRGPASVTGFLRQILRGRDGPTYDPGISPDPSPPTFQEMWFLGNTSDGIVSDDKAGEPTPFYVTMLPSLDAPIGPNLVPRGVLSNFSTTIPPPALNADGMGAPAVLLPHPIQQPVRLYDRGLPTEHYGFYNYFSKTIYTTSINSSDANAGSNGAVVADLNGGALESQAQWLVTWGMTRFKVEFWTRSSNTTKLVNGGPNTVGDNSTRPGTFPYPAAFTLDTHGGQPGLKGTYAFGVTPDQHIDTSNFKFVPVSYGAGGTQINPAGVNNTSFGGFDGGTGGCQCVYQNFVGITPSAQGQ